MNKSDFISEIHLKDFPLVSTRFDLFFEGINQKNSLLFNASLHSSSIIAFSPIIQAKRHGLNREI